MDLIYALVVIIVVIILVVVLLKVLALLLVAPFAFDHQQEVAFLTQYIQPLRI